MDTNDQSTQETPPPSGSNNVSRRNFLKLVLATAGGLCINSFPDLARAAEDQLPQEQQLDVEQLPDIFLEGAKDLLTKGAVDQNDPEQYSNLEDLANRGNACGPALITTLINFITLLRNGGDTSALFTIQDVIDALRDIELYRIGENEEHIPIPGYNLILPNLLMHALAVPQGLMHLLNQRPNPNVNEWDILIPNGNGQNPKAPLMDIDLYNDLTGTRQALINVGNLGLFRGLSDRLGGLILHTGIDGGHFVATFGKAKYIEGKGLCVEMIYDSKGYPVADPIYDYLGSGNANIVVTGEEVDIPGLVYIDENGERWIVLEEYVKAAATFPERGSLYPHGIPGRTLPWTGIMGVYGFGPSEDSYMANLHWLLRARQESTPPIPIVKNNGIPEPLYES